MARYLDEISVIIPVYDGEQDLSALSAQLEKHGAQVIVSNEGSRAKSMNIGAKSSNRKFLWFLHADSQIDEACLIALNTALSQHPERLQYFKLAFNISRGKIKINATGANLRSKILGCPFGDQGLCIRKDLFFALGGYDETAEYGEDHLFVWAARRRKVKLNAVDATITTSARKYETHGWLKTTLTHQYLFIKQALPQWWLLMRGK